MEENRYSFCDGCKSWIHDIRKTWSNTCGCKADITLSKVDNDGKSFKESKANKKMEIPLTTKQLENFKVRAIGHINKYGKGIGLSALSLHTNHIMHIEEVPDLVIAYPNVFELINGEDREFKGKAYLKLKK